MKDKNIIIIKKVKKQGEEGEHGGQWKVAYADFVTALMAFFLLMWLLAMVAPEKKERLASYFKEFEIFNESGQSFMGKSSEVINNAGKARKVPRELQGTSNMKPEEFKEVIKRAIEEKLGDIKDQIIVDIFEGGVRVQLMDKEGRPMFDLGSTKPTSLAVRILRVIGDNIKFLPNSVAVEGHTDSLAYSSTGYGNWDLSTERALAAKKELEKNGLESKRLIRVAGYSDTVPLVKEDPRDPRNRRISILLMFPDKSENPGVRSQESE
ncbi:MAG: OmpA family protein [Desulfobacterales bacterium]|jgi:chemotaxis protein MotB|nr:OmpA family protein [Desulfobacterales bacterium]